MRKTVSLLLCLGFVTLFAQTKKEKKLFDYCKMGNIEKIQKLVEKGININATNTLNETPLHISIWENNIELSHYLISQGAEIDAADINGQTPLFIAIGNENLQLVKTLLEHKADPTHSLPNFCLSYLKERPDRYFNVIIKKENHGFTPLIMAIDRKNFEIFSEVLKYTSNVDFEFKNDVFIKSESVQKLYLMPKLMNDSWIAQSGNVNFNGVKMFFSNDTIFCVVKNKPINGKTLTPLLYSIYMQDYQIVKKLAQISSPEKNKEAIKIATIINDSTILSILKDNGY